MRNWIALLISIALLSPVMAADIGADALKARLTKSLPGFVPDKLKPSPVEGLYEVTMGTTVMYVSADGRHLLLGDIIDIKTKQNLSGATRGQLILTEIDTVPESQMIIIEPKKVRRTITVFTDVECPYCIKLHRDVPKLVAAGLRVRYMFFPRAGEGSSSYKKSVAVWCAKDRVDALGKAKFGGKLEMKTCKNPVTRHYQLGQRVGVRGTPMIVYDDGQVQAGYSPAAKMLEALGLSENKKVSVR
ncbi:MAG: DsbC family protein [Gammaproteobacteria bacterium]|nr:DsbC family protein [Gammaproteobacteria bacterium]